MHITLPEQVQFIIRTLESQGHEAYAVGGCVRDSILGLAPHDWDVTTSATPKQIKSCFSHTVDTGIQHGTVTVLLRKAHPACTIRNGGHAISKSSDSASAPSVPAQTEILTDRDSFGLPILGAPEEAGSPWNSYEVTTFRIDGDYRDSRHPSSVTFTSLLSEDLRRRDFTVNAMAYNDASGLVDLFGGQEDLSARVIRCVGDPAERFSEDALRMLRAVRFSAQLNAVLAPDTEAAIAALAPTLSHISAERIREELCRLLTTAHPEKVRDLRLLGLTKVFLPEWDVLCKTPQHTPHHQYDVEKHTLVVLTSLADGSADRCWTDAGITDYPLCRSAREELLLRLAALLHDMGKPARRTTDENGIDHFHGHPLPSADIARDILHRLRFDNDAIARVTRLVRWHDERPHTERAVRRLAAKMPAEDFVLLLQLRMADALGQSLFRREEKLEQVCDMWRFYQRIRQRNDALSVKDLAINGSDLLALGVPAGRAVGEVLHQLLELVLDEPALNTKEALTRAAEEYMQHLSGL